MAQGAGQSPGGLGLVSMGTAEAREITGGKGLYSEGGNLMGRGVHPSRRGGGHGT